MSSSLHSATFTWPASHHSRVFVTGSFDNWSGSTHALTKQDDGSFKGQVEIKYGEKVAYKYVCDGEWMTREDEDKEWGEFQGPAFWGSKSGWRLDEGVG